MEVIELNILKDKIIKKRMKHIGQKLQFQLEGSEEKHLQTLKERFFRWQNKQLNLLTLGTNLIFTISIAAIGLLISYIDKSVFKDKFMLGKLKGKKIDRPIIVSKKEMIFLNTSKH
jgi:hypothetical protein